MQRALCTEAVGLVSDVHSCRRRRTAWGSGAHSSAVNEIELRLHRSGGALARSTHRDIAGTLDRGLRTGALVSVLPGVYCAAGDISAPQVRLRAALLWAGPDAVLTGLSAAHLTFWPTCRLDAVTVAVPTNSKASRPGVAVERRRIPPDLVLRRTGCAVTVPALTAVDLAVRPDGGDVIDRVLRTGSATVDQMWDAHRRQPQRAGNALRAALLTDSRDEPWSEAERYAHRLLRAARISGWRTNVWVRVGETGYFLDLLFHRERVALEIDGWQTHGTRTAFEDDRRRRNELVLRDYLVLNFTWWQLVDDPSWVLDSVRRALRR